jgi:hypothetical protein
MKVSVVTLPVLRSRTVMVVTSGAKTTKKPGC